LWVALRRPFPYARLPAADLARAAQPDHLDAEASGLGYLLGVARPVVAVLADDGAQQRAAAEQRSAPGQPACLWAVVAPGQLAQLEQASRALARAAKVLFEGLELVEERGADLHVAALWAALEDVAPRAAVMSAAATVVTLMPEDEWRRLREEYELLRSRVLEELDRHHPGASEPSRLVS
jgi:hypothetical protein